MLDIQLLRADAAGIAARLKTRGFELDVARSAELDNGTQGRCRPAPRTCRRSAMPCPNR